MFAAFVESLPRLPLAACLLLVSSASAWALESAPYCSPQVVVASPDGKTLYVADRTAGCVTALPTTSKSSPRNIPMPGEPAELALSEDGKQLFVAVRTVNLVAVVDTGSGQITRRIQAGPWPVDVALAPQAGRLLTANRGDHSIRVIDLHSGKTLHHVPMVRDPARLAVTPDEKRCVVANLLPKGAGTNPTLAAAVSIVDLESLGGAKTTTIELPPGSTMAAGLCLSPDGRWTYVVHALGRFNLPITQLERGWVHTYALSIIDLHAEKRLATVLLDDMTGGAADPWDVLCSPDGATLWISHAGIHRLSAIDVSRLHGLLAGNVPEELTTLKVEGANAWARIAEDPAAVADLQEDLTAMWLAELIHRLPCGGKGPRGLAMSPDGSRLFVANYFSGTVGVIDAADRKLIGTLPLGNQPEADAARRGELYFHDATRCFQRWHSCATCHPDDGRVDGLPWDFMRDGIGNGKDVISLVYTHHTPPHNRRATRATPRECMRTGVIGSHLVVPEEGDVDDLLAYVKSLEPEPNPMTPHLAEAAARGKALFEGKAECSGCHPAPYFTDRKMHNVGIVSRDEPDGRYDTPSLIEAYRTAPYYHDGRAATLRDALVEHDPEGLHGNLGELTSEEIDDLVAYLKTL